MYKKWKLKPRQYTMSVGTEENVLQLFVHHAYIIYVYIY